MTAPAGWERRRWSRRRIRTRHGPSWPRSGTTAPRSTAASWAADSNNPGTQNGLWFPHRSKRSVTSSRPRDFCYVIADNGLPGMCRSRGYSRARRFPYSEGFLMRSVRRLQVPAILSLMAVMALSSAGQADGATTGAAASPAARSADATDKVIVVLRDQAASLPDTAADARMRTADVAALQDNVLAQLAQTHARDVHRITLINAVAATVSPAESARLAASPDVAEVIPDLPVQLAPGPLAVTPPEAPSQPAAGSPRPLPGACAPDGQVQLDPEALDVIHAASAGGDSAQALGYTGAGVKVAILADGIDPDNPDFIRPNGSHVIVGYKDFTGGGTSASTYGGEAFQDAASIAAQGRVVYNLAAFGPHKLSVPCRIRILGVAPGADVVDLEVANKAATAISEILEAIDYAVTSEHVNIINESVGVNSFPDTASLDVMALANEAGVRAPGANNTVDPPAARSDVILGRGVHDIPRLLQAGVMPPEARGWLDNNISAF